jgi:hypothetical protein
MSLAFLPRPIDPYLLGEHQRVWPGIAEERLYKICVHCGHYGFERDLNYDECYVVGCDCCSSNPLRDEEVCVEHMLSLWLPGQISQYLGDSYAMDREKHFARHCQDATFVTITLKHKYTELACKMHNALDDQGKFAIIPHETQNISHTDEYVSLVTGFSDEKTLFSLQILLKKEYCSLVLEYQEAINNGAKITVISTVPDFAHPTILENSYICHKETEENDSLIPF